MDNAFHTPLGDFNLRCDNANDHSIQAWSQADHYLLHRLEKHPDFSRQCIGIINDEWGALSIATQSLQTVIYSDSAIFSAWLQKNSGSSPIPLVHNIGELAQSPAQLFLMRLPKNLHFFTHQLSLLSQLPDITVYVAGMQKYWPASFYQAAHEYFTEVEIYEGIRKAKCMRLGKGKNNALPALTNTLAIHEHGLVAINYPNVFSRESLDIGTRFFLENFPDLGACRQVIDLACGNGLLGIKALRDFPQLHACFIDESFYAIQSCAASLRENAIEENRYDLYQNNIMHGLQLPGADAILCNPPFHQLHRVGDHIASAMIRHSARILNNDGCLYLIGNRHLQYRALLKKHFRHVQQSAANNKFILFECHAGD